jgi:hypothetical protein
LRIAFKHKLKEKRIKEKLNQKTIETESEAQTLKLPEVHSFCASQFRISKQLIAANDWKEGVQHLCYGLVVCYEPQNYFQNYKRIHSERDFNYLKEIFPSVEQILRNACYGDHQESGD